MILRFEPLEGRQLMAAGATPLPDLVATSFSTTATGDWGQSIQVRGTIANVGTAALPSGTVAEIYASPTNTIGSTALPLGSVAIPAGLAPGATEPFVTTVVLPPSPLSGMGMNSPLFIDMDIDPRNLIAESNKANNQGQGLGIDESIVTITPQPMANLIGTAFDISTSSATWGQTISVTAQIKDNGQGPAPATRAKIVLTPDGQVPGGAGDVTIGNIAVPALLPFQTVNLVQQITLPATPPNTIGNSGTYTISMIQDAGHLTSPLVQQVTMQGSGLDEATINIPYPASAAAASTTTTTSTATGTTTTTTTATTALPDLAPSSITLPTSTFNWGQGYVVDTTVQNLGQAASKPTTVEFLLTADTASPTQGYYLGQAALPALAPGIGQSISQTIVLPNRVPNGISVPALTYGRVMAIVDPENLVNQSTRNNSDSQSGPVALRLLWGGPNSFVPTDPPIRTSQPIAATATATVTTPAPTAITPQDAAKQAKWARFQDRTFGSRSTKAGKQSMAAAIAYELRAERALAARTRAYKAAVFAARHRPPNIILQTLINNQNNTNSTIVGVLKKL